MFILATIMLVSVAFFLVCAVFAVAYIDARTMDAAYRAAGLVPPRGPLNALVDVVAVVGPGLALCIVMGWFMGHCPSVDVPPVVGLATLAPLALSRRIRSEISALDADMPGVAVATAVLTPRVTLTALNAGLDRALDADNAVVAWEFVRAATGPTGMLWLRQTAQNGPESWLDSWECALATEGRIEALTLAQSIPGIGPVKAPFALAMGGAECEDEGALVCLDRHWLRHLGLSDAPRKTADYVRSIDALNMTTDASWVWWCANLATGNGGQPRTGYKGHDTRSILRLHATIAHKLAELIARRGWPVV